MSDRPRRAVLHQRSDSETNTIRTLHSTHSNNSSVSQKTNEVSTWQPPTSATISRDSTRSSSRTTSTARSVQLRPSGSLDSLPPVTPLKIHKRFPSTIAVARDPPSTIGDKEPTHSSTLASSSTGSLNLIIPGNSKYPRSILKKPSRAALPPFTTEEYSQISSAWLGNNPDDHLLSQARMNTRTLRIVRSSGNVEGGEEGQTGGASQATGGHRGSASVTISSRPSPRLASDTGSASYGDPGERAGTSIIPSQRSLTPAVSSLSFRRADDSPGQPFGLAKQFPAWARYFYGKKGGRASVIIEPETGGNGGALGNEGVGTVAFDPSVRRQPSGNSMRITQIPPPGAVHHYPRRMTSSSSTPGLDWIGRRTRDPEIATVWSLPHLDRAPLTRFENLNRQLILFCLGFVLPFCWVIAAFLPLPPHEEASNKPPRPSSQKQPSHSADPEQARGYSHEEKERYENARWWRKINRILSVVGLLVMGIIIGLAAAAASNGT